MRCILDKSDEYQNIGQAVPYLEGANSKIIPYDVEFCTIERPRAVQSHMPYSCMLCGPPKDTPGKYILYVTRNPKDTAVSFFNFYFSNKIAENIDWPTFASWFLSGQVYSGSYLNHVLGW